MSFTVEIKEPGVIRLSDTAASTAAEIFATGALLNKFELQHSNGCIYNCIDGLSGINEVPNNSWFKSAKMSPFVCRLSNAAFGFGGKEYKTGRTFSGVHAIHGLIYDAGFSIVSSNANEQQAAVKLTYQWPGDNGFPFAYQMDVTYTLRADSALTIQTSLINTGNSAMPCADGWHPYFNMQAATDECSIAMQPVGKLKMNAELIPTGHIADASPFSGLISLRDLHLDDCFLLDAINTDCTLKGPFYQIKIAAHDSYPYLQIFTPDHRQSIAIENLSSAPDAFNNGMGLIILEPGQSKDFITSFQVQGL